MPLADEIDAAIVEVKVNLELGVREKKIDNRRRQVKHSERHRRGHFERASEFALQAPRHLLGLDDIGKDAASPLVIGLPGLGQAETARRAIEEARPQSGFK